MAKKSKRIKSDKPLVIPVKGWAEADKMVKRIGQLQFEIASHEKQAADDINDAKAALAVAAKPLLEKIKLHTQSLEAFAVNHRSDFGKAQSKKLGFGCTGWRFSTAISVKKNTLELIRSVFGRTYKKYVHIKETVNKEALKQLTDEKLAKISAQRKSKEAFFVEPESQKAIDYEDTKRPHS